MRLINVSEYSGLVSEGRARARVWSRCTGGSSGGLPWMMPYVMRAGSKAPAQRAAVHGATEVEPLDAAAPEDQPFPASDQRRGGPGPQFPPAVT